MDDDLLAKQLFSKAPNGTRRSRERTRWGYQDGEEQLALETRGGGKSIQRRPPILITVYV
uniref:Uncharacterized protein n=1 Tax=Megaselia scalaris TaxID=36166 RepID=T1GZP2_MEGSC